MKKQINVVGAIIVKNGKILCAQRGYDKSLPELWEFPGGKIKDNESREEALIREIKEELNASINIDKYLTTVEYDYPEFHLTMHTYICTLNNDIEFVYHNSNELEHDNMIWLEKSDLDKLDWLPADISIISAYRRN